MDRSEYESTPDLDPLLDRVERGEEVVIARDGRPVAKLVRLHSHTAAEVDEAIEKLRTFRARHKITTSMTTDEIIAARHEGRRY